MASLALAIAGLASAGIGATGSIIAGSEQAGAAQKGIDFQSQAFQQMMKNIAPFMGGGQQSLGMLMQGLSNGTFGPGSIPQFQAPTPESVAQTPGYQFTLQQTNQGLKNALAAQGSLGRGGAMKEIAQYDTNLANTTYGQRFNEALGTYGAQLQGQQQAYNQLFQPIALGENAAVQSGYQANQAAGNIGNLMGSLGSAQAAGTLGLTNSLSGGVNNIANLALLGKLFGGGGFGGGGAGQIGTGILTPGTGSTITGGWQDVPS